MLNYTSAAAFRQHAEKTKQTANNTLNGIVSIGVASIRMFSIDATCDSASSGCSVFYRSRWFGHCVQETKGIHWASGYAANLHLIHGTGIEAKYPENCQCKWTFERRIQAVSENSPGFRHSISICQFFCWSFCFHQFLHLLVTVRDTHAVNSCGLDSGGECLGARGFSQVGLASWPCRRYLIISLSIQKNG